MNVRCPSCGESGKLPRQLVGMRIKCKKCSTSFVVGSPDGASSIDPDETGPHGDEIDVAGLDAASWSNPGASPLSHDTEADAGSSLFTASPVEPQRDPRPASNAGAKEYKILWQKDKWFEGRFDLARLEEALNHFAKDGWVVRSMVTPHITGFSGGAREELVVLLER